MNRPSQILVFDRQLVRAHRDRAAPGFAAHNALFEESAAQLIERLGDIKQDFLSALDLGAHEGTLARHLRKRNIPFVVAADVSEKMLRPAVNAVVADEEYLPFATQSFDLVMSNLSLHWVNDLPGALTQIKNTLKPDGLFLAALIGGSSLAELRISLLEAELAVTGGASPRFSPTVDMATASGLLQRAGFSLPVTDEEKIIFEYDDLAALMRDLRGMGEANAHLQRLRGITRRQVFDEAERIYRQRFATPTGCIQASFEVLFLHGVRK